MCALKKDVCSVRPKSYALFIINHYIYYLNVCVCVCVCVCVTVCVTVCDLCVCSTSCKFILHY